MDHARFQKLLDATQRGLTMSIVQENHQDLENVVQAKIGDIEHRKRYGSMEDRLKAWGEFLVKTNRKNLTLDHHYSLHRLIRKAMRRGTSEVNINIWIKQGRNQYTSTRPINIREELLWID